MSTSPLKTPLPPPMTQFRLRWEQHGGHTHVRLFAGRGQTLGLAGNFVMRNDEWAVFKSQLPSTFQVLHENEDARGTRS